jgi:hypothetical protein
MLCFIMVMVAVGVTYLLGPNFDFQVGKDLWHRLVDKVKWKL